MDTGFWFNVTHDTRNKRYEKCNVTPYHTKVNLAEDGRSVEANAKGDVRIATRTHKGRNTVNIKDVLVVPKLRTNLLSISQLNRNGHTVIFKNRTAKIMGPANRVVAEAEEKNGIFILKGETLEQVNLVEEPISQEERESEKKSLGKQPKGTKLEKMLWHKRLGHVCDEYIENMIKTDAVRDMESSREKLGICESCIMGNLAQKPHQAKGPTSTQPMQLIHMDLCGPMATPSIDGNLYIFVLIDDYSRYTTTIHEQVGKSNGKKDQRSEIG